PAIPSDADTTGAAGTTSDANSTQSQSEPPPPANGPVTPPAPPVNAPAPTYIVDVNNPAASDSNPGTLEQPLKSIQRAADLSKPGDLVAIRSGTYSSNPYLPVAVAYPIVNISRSGTEQAPIVFQAYQNADGKYDEPVIDGGNYRSVACTVH